VPAGRFSDALCQTRHRPTKKFDQPLTTPKGSMMNLALTSLSEVWSS
jgi:hypothetical protein